MTTCPMYPAAGDMTQPHCVARGRPTHVNTGSAFSSGTAVVASVTTAATAKVHSRTRHGVSHVVTLPASLDAGQRTCHR